MHYKLAFFLLFSIFSSYAQDNPPSITASQGSTFCQESIIPIATNVSITDPDITDTTLDTVVIQISQGYSPGQDVLSLSINQPNITAVWNPNEGQLILSGVSTFAEYETAIEAVVFETTATTFTEDKFFSINIGNANYLPSTDHYYFYVADLGITWADAKIASENQTFFGLQGYLATITTAEESQLAGEQSPGTGWIGASDSETEGTWKWVTGPEAGTVFWIGVTDGAIQNGEFNFWNTAEPNNFQGDEDYAHITDPSIGQTGSWNDLPNAGNPPGSPYHPKGYLVEFGGLPGEPTINLSTSTTLITPKIIAVNDDIRCGNGVANLSMTTNTDTVLWFENETSTVVLNDGFNYNPTINTTTTYWALPSFGGCLTGLRTQITATVNSIPDAIDISVFQCDDSVVSDGVSMFNINFYFPDITGGVETNRSIDYFLDAALTQPINGDNYTNISNPQTIYCLITNTETLCTNTSEAVLEVNINAVNNATLAACDEDDNDGLSIFDLSESNAQVLSGLPNGLTTAFYATFSDAILQNSMLPNDYTNITANNQTIYARVLDEDTCYGIAEVELIVNSLPPIEEQETIYYCINTFPDPINLSSGILGDPNNFSYNWSTGDISERILINTPGDFTVLITNNTTNCFVEKTITVLPSNIATIEAIDVVDVSANNSIKVTVSGEGNYQFSLDNITGPYQESNVFNNVTAAVHTVYVKDLLSDCGIASQEVSVIGYSNYFTPNGDNINETWSINGLSDNFQGIFVVNIYDRYGKLIYALKDKDDDWNGMYNGFIMPNSDYWFTAFLGKGRNFKGHFTLKR